MVISLSHLCIKYAYVHKFLWIHYVNNLLMSLKTLKRLLQVTVQNLFRCSN